MNKLDKDVLKLFKKVMVKDTTKGVRPKIWNRFIFMPEVVAEHPDIEKLAEDIEKTLFLSGSQLNSSFHKSWEKIREARMDILVMEQVIHYATTYGFENLGIFDHDKVFIPTEKLEIPKLDLDQIEYMCISGMTVEALRSNIFDLIKSGIALKEETIKILVSLIDRYNITISSEDLEQINNKEMKIILYSDLGLAPKNPVEILRLIIYILTDKTLLIKNKDLIEKIKAVNSRPLLKQIDKYFSEYNLKKLAEIFYRFKTLFLALKGKNERINSAINRIRKLAKKHHKPMKADYLNSITSMEYISEERLKEELEKVNIYRKIRLYNSLRYRRKNIGSIVYRIRNGKTYATECSGSRNYTTALRTIHRSIETDIEKGEYKDIYIPENIYYALPTSEKNFTGNIPLGTYVEIENDMVFGVYWENVKSKRIDLDLSLVSLTEKLGWDSSYRKGDRSILFSGDVTNALGGASELFYIENKRPGVYLMFVNYYNYNKEVPVPFSIFVGEEKAKRLNKNYMVDPNNIILQADTIMDRRQKLLGIVVVNEESSKFYFAESKIGKEITSRNKPYNSHQIVYYVNFFMDMLYFDNIGSLNILEEGKRQMAEVDLSYESLTKGIFTEIIK